MVNRVWADLMGRGIVDPVDDLRATNPPSNPELLEALAQNFRTNRYDLKKLIRTITTSYAYQLSTTPNESNAADLRNYSRHYRQRLRAEVLLDMVCDITGIPERFEAMPPGSRAMELWTVRSQSLFLDSFGRPDPNQDPPCERTSETPRPCTGKSPPTTAAVRSWPKVPKPPLKSSKNCTCSPTAATRPTPNGSTPSNASRRKEPPDAVPPKTFCGPSSIPRNSSSTTERRPMAWLSYKCQTGGC
jgi:hypothetical protein